uniref:F-box domain-containing protein n=1 Tax=Leersia perrieri TaxID=77586 RepID=A0A0D9XQ89_9ORYZ
MPHWRRKAPTRAVAAVGGPVCISALPDEVIQLILSFLPAHDAVRTCVLARRWRHLWRDAPALRIHYIREWEDSDYPEIGVEKFDRFMDNLFSLRCRGAPLEYCEFDFDRPVSFFPYNPDAVRWIRRAFRCRARVLRFVFNETIELPDVPLISQHLTRLEVQCVSFHGDSSDFSECPLLVDQKMRECILEKNMWSPSLKMLSIVNCEFTGNLLSFPSLVSLELDCGENRAPFLESMPSLEEATLIFDHTIKDLCSNNIFGDCGEDNCQGCSYFSGTTPVNNHTDCVLLNGVSEATDLKLLAHPDVYVFRRDLKWCPTFYNLKTLLLNECCLVGDLSVLICFLQHSPLLEKLTIQLEKAPTCLMDLEGLYNTEQPFTSDHLKFVPIECKEVNLCVWKILKTLSTFGIPLKQINVKQTSKCNESGWRLALLGRSRVQLG